MQETTMAKKTFTVSRGFEYSYLIAPPKCDKPTLLLLHGFPDSADLWQNLARKHLFPAGYGVIAPDCLGYAGTSKPTDPAAYVFSLMVRDILDILDAENISKFIVLGHDWGSSFAQRVYNHAPERVLGLAMVNVPYLPPTHEPFNLDATLARTEQNFGYGLFWYWKLFAADDGAELLNKNLDSLFDAAHVPGEQFKELFCAPDALRKFLAGGLRLQVQEYATEEMRKVFVTRFEKDGFEAPLCWYKSQVFGFKDGDDNLANAKVKCPALFMGFDKDFVCRKEMIAMSEQAGLLPNLTKIDMEGSHWGLLDKPTEFGEAVVGWLKTTFPA